MTKQIILMIPIAVTPALLLAQADLGTFELVLNALAQLPLVAGMAWILLRQQDRHQSTVDKLITEFSARSEQKDAIYQLTLDRLLGLVADLAKK